ncbi:hypothetical protein ACR77X_13850 [Bacteroides salyersiae]|uniref:hypothetical protein n=1 Tax=Bacteroides salyersiae TaxID=291644 RepID=UPI003DA623A8
MEKYIITGQEKELTRVLREQRIRVSRGLISITPLTKAGLVTEEDARKTLDCKLTEKDEEINKLIEIIAEKDMTVVELTGERDTMKSRIAELESLNSPDNKKLPDVDSKEMPEGDAKEVTVVDDKTLSLEDEKKTGKGKTSK